jgi:4-amino-4-deoxy-L-arabinose transferase-like glycosyltransferase
VSTPERGETPRWIDWAVGAIVAVVAFTMIWVALFPAPHNGGDNAGYLTLAHSLLTRGAYLDLWRPDQAAHTKYPPLYPLVLAVLMAVGAKSWTAFKAFSALCVVGTAVLAYAWVAQTRNRWGAALLALIVALSPGFLWASNWILSDPLFVLLTMVALYAFGRAESLEGFRVLGGGVPKDARTGAPTTPERRRLLLWITLGGTAAILATLTRTAGLPLVLAVGGVLLLARRRTALVVFGVGVLLPQLLWWWRSRGTGDAAYISEFWMVNPYDPSAGTAGMGDLFARMWENLLGYSLTHIPAGLTTYGDGLLKALGVTLLVLAIAGWAVRVRDRIGFAELFTPLYFGLILLWPAVWSGDRFALPLFPVLLFYAWGGLDLAVARLRSRGTGVLAGAFAVILLVPSLQGWSEANQRAAACRVLVEQAGPFACYGEGFQEFVSAARWMGENAPDGAVVLTRKPRIFYTLSGLSSDTYPFTTEPDEFFEAAQRAGASYVILDRVDGLGYGYVAQVIQASPGRFCSLGGIGNQGRARTELLGLLPEDSGSESLTACPESMVRAFPRAVPDYSASTLPLLSLATP